MLRRISFLWISGISLGFGLWLAAYPSFCLLYLKLSSKNKGANLFYHQGRVTELMTEVVLPNPDFFYSICGFNIDAGPIKVSFTPPKNAYWSISVYDYKTNVIWKTSDDVEKTNKDSQLQLIISSKNHPKITYDRNTSYLESPFSQGAVLLRILAQTPDQDQRLLEAQKTAKCDPL